MCSSIAKVAVMVNVVIAHSVAALMLFYWSICCWSYSVCCCCDCCEI